MSDSLYRKYAFIYSEISKNRDFYQEIKNLGALDLDRNSSFVELFAGPAYHCIELKKQGWGGKIIAIDNSEQMKEVSEKLNFSGNYICSDVNDALENLSNLELILIPKFSIVLVDREYLDQLLKKARKALSKTGVMYIEICKGSCVDENMYIAGELAQDGKYISTFDTSMGKVRKSWPHNIKFLNELENVAEITMKLEYKTQEKVERLEFVTTENIYTKPELEELFKKQGFQECNKSSFDMDESYFMAIKASNVIESKLEQLKTLSMCKVFDISTDEKRCAHLERSGLNCEDHNMSLSCYVYNLL